MEEQKTAIREIALSCLLAICGDPDVRAADRVTAQESEG